MGWRGKDLHSLLQRWNNQEMGIRKKAPKWLNYLKTLSADNQTRLVPFYAGIIRHSSKIPCDIENLTWDHQSITQRAVPLHGTAQCASSISLSQMGRFVPGLSLSQTAQRAREILISSRVVTHCFNFIQTAVIEIESLHRTNFHVGCIFSSPPSEENVQHKDY